MTHPFEAAGLGAAPFAFLGIEEKVFVIPGVMAKAGGSCQYCGTGIRYCYWVKPATGNNFYVGSECIAKACRPGGPILTAAAKAEKKLMKAKKTASLAERLEAAKAALAANPELLTKAVHPNNRSYVEWCFKFAGAAGKTKACKIVEKAIEAEEAVL